MEKKGSNVDAEVKQELLEIEVRLNTTLQGALSKFSNDVQMTIEKLFNKDIEHINEKLIHFQSNHREHFENDKERRKEIDAIKTLVTTVMIESSTKDKIEDKTGRKKEISNGTIAMLCGVFSFITGIVVYFIR